jgi:hypothetical protein
MPYRTRPRYQAHVAQLRGEAPEGSAERGNCSSAPEILSLAGKPEGRHEPSTVLEALDEMLNAPGARDTAVPGRRGGL